jgi:hypothetical protein
LALDYNIPLKEAYEARDLAARLLKSSGLTMEKDPRKQNCWNLDYPETKANQHQIGAISLGGQEPKVSAKQTCAYVEIRFDKGQVMTRGLLEQLSDIKLCRDHTEDFLKWKFNKAHLGHVEDVAKQIAQNFKEKKTPD